MGTRERERLGNRNNAVLSGRIAFLLHTTALDEGKDLPLRFTSFGCIQVLPTYQADLFFSCSIITKITNYGRDGFGMGSNAISFQLIVLEDEDRSVIRCSIGPRSAPGNDP